MLIGTPCCAASIPLGSSPMPMSPGVFPCNLTSGPCGGECSTAATVFWLCCELVVRNPVACSASLFRNTRNYQDFILKLFLSGILTFTWLRKGRATPFSVKKKSGALRLFLGCSQVNAFF